ncbi:centrosomal protein of 76 kda [Anaeramoeba flamelloides]|uniref:Centrosomal protein of 76 kDa n=1 Tax=Anaeramoeba flamelloides TaxID=1746091 RepID=A0AAV7ZAF2_9EUKA|nr:centrosomal protein of 76 kda [Anaeramoeba flamelloides]
MSDSEKNDNKKIELEKSSSESENDKDEKKKLDQDDSDTTSDEDEDQKPQTVVVKEPLLKKKNKEEKLPKGPKYKLLIRNILLRETTLSQPKVRFTFCGNRKVIDERHKGGEKKKIGKRGTVFTTRKATVETGGNNAGSFSKTFVKYKRFQSYEEIKEQFLKVELLEAGCCCRSTSKGFVKINLEELANSSIQREVQCEEHKKGSHKIVGKVYFHCYFQEIFDFKLHFYDFVGKSLYHKENKLPDPYLHLKIEPKFLNLVKLSKNYTKRGCESSHELNTNNPRWEEIGQITYRGILSELENEDLICNVYNHSLLKKDPKLCEGLIELRGFLDYGIIMGALANIQESKVKNESTGSKEIVRKYTAGGSIEGIVECVDLPLHRQYGDIILLKPGRNYLAVRVLRCQNLRSTDPNSFSDPFVIVEFGGLKQRTRVIKRCLDPVFEETLYFTLRVPVLTEVEVGKLGNVQIYVFDEDQAGDDFLGSCEVPLKDIVKSPAMDAGEGKNKIKSRLLSTSLNLDFNAEETDQSIDVQFWFHPDLPEDFTFKDLQIKQKKTKLKKVYQKRIETWKKGIPETHLQEGNFEIIGADESYCEHLISEYISPITLPKELRNINTILRTIKCFTFENDEATFGGRQDVWCSPNFFLSLMKGSTEEHAALGVSLFLGLELDAYLCLGKTKNGVDHYWIMVREKSGDITFYETILSKAYKLENKWQGTSVDEENQDEKRKKKKASKKEKEKEKKDDSGSSDDDELEKSKKNKKKIQLEDESEESDNEKGNKLNQNVKKNKKIPYMTIEIIANHNNIWANIQETLDPSEICYDLDNKKLWNPYVDQEEGFKKKIKPFYDQIRLRPRIPLRRAENFALQITKEVIGGFTNFRHGNHQKTVFLKKFEKVISGGLSYLEKIESNEYTEKDKLAFLKSKGKLTELTPPGYTFEGVPLNFNYTDKVRIRKHIMEKYDFHLDKDINTIFACGSYVHPYYGGVNSVWVMICVMRVKPQEEEESEEGEEGEEKEKEKGKGKGKETKKKKEKKDSDLNSNDELELDEIKKDDENDGSGSD